MNSNIRDDMQRGATGWNQTHGHRGMDTAFVYGAPALPTEPPGAQIFSPSHTDIYINKCL